jgi:hypothetical protein
LAASHVTRAVSMVWMTTARVYRPLNHWMDDSLDVLNLFNCKYFNIAYAQNYRATSNGPIVPDGVTVHEV